MSNLLNEEKKPYLWSILYVVLSTVFFSIAFLFFDLVEKFASMEISIEDIRIPFSIFIVFMNIFLLPKLVKFNKKNISADPSHP